MGSSYDRMLVDLLKKDHSFWLQYDQLNRKPNDGKILLQSMFFLDDFYKENMKVMHTFDTNGLFFKEASLAK